MLIVIPIGIIVTAFLYFIGILFVAKIVEIIGNGLSDIIVAFQQLSPKFSNFNLNVTGLTIFVFVFILSIIYFAFETRYNPWQKILGYLNILLLVPFILYFTGTFSFLKNPIPLIYLFFIIYFVIFILAHAKFRIFESKFNSFCKILIHFLNKISMWLIYVSLLSLYCSVIYFHDVRNTSLFLNIVYWVFIVFANYIGSMCLYSEIFSTQKNEPILFFLKESFASLLILLLMSASAFYNVFFLEKIKTLHSIIVINSGIILILGIILLPRRLKKEVRCE